MCSIPEELDFTVRTFNCLKRAGIHSFADVCEKIAEGIPSCMRIHNLDLRMFEEMLQKAQEAGYPAHRAVDHYVSALRTDPQNSLDAIRYWEVLSDSLRCIDVDSRQYD